jgi:two-component system, chemotaxis family, chemotaxis protein CheY
MADKPWNGRKIIIIDDSKPVRDALKVTYSSLGLQVVGLAENGLVGLRLIREHRPDIVNLDLIMPEMDGVECYRKIRELDAGIKCLINSWLSGEAKVISGLSELIPAHLFQPKTTSSSALELRLDILYNPQKASPKARPNEETKPDNDDFSELGIKVS